MTIADEIEQQVKGSLNQTWNLRDGQVAPTTDSVVFAGGGVQLNATLLYSDLVDSTQLAMWDRQVTARICKAFLGAATRIIRAQGGDVRSFDGDRVMGVFLGNRKNTSAALCALQINWMFTQILKPAFETRYEKLRDGTFKLAHCTAIDSSDVLAVRAGIRNNDDLIWVGRAPNIAAKLSALREEYFHSYVSGEVYDMLHDDAKLFQGTNMWEQRIWNNGPVTRIFRSSWWRKPGT